MATIHGNVIDIAGQRFARLVAIEYAGEAKWRCLCDCGQIKVTARTRLVNGSCRSCGCLRDELRRTHGQPRDKAYRAWMGMIQRCTNRRFKQWKDYGGRGISVCERWRDYANFLDDMGRPSDRRMTLDRIDNARGYEPGNCRWATRSEQNNNTRRNVLLTRDGRTMTITEWARATGLSKSMLFDRHRAGLSDADVLTLPVGRRAQRFEMADGSVVTLAEAAARAGVTYDFLEQRVRRRGMTLAQALATPKQTFRRHEIDGRSMTARAWALERGLAPSVVRRRLKRGLTIEAAIGM